MSTGELGPVDYAVIAFPGSRFTGEIAPAITELVDSGTVRVIDLVVIEKADDGTAQALELSQLDPAVQAAFEREGIEAEGLFDDSDVQAAADELQPGSSAVLLVWENLWARRIADATREAGGELLDFGRLPHEVVQIAHDYAVTTAGEGH